MVPADLGLPFAFSKFRPGQEEMILNIGCDDGHRFTLLSAPTGCVAGDTVITISRGGGLLASKRRTVAEEFINQYNPNRKHYQTFTRSWLGNKIGLHAIREVAYNGPKLTYRLELENGRILRATADHPILTSNDWVQLGSLTGTALVLCDSDRIPRTGKGDKKTYRQVQGLVFHPYANNAESKRHRNGWKPEGRLYRVPYHRLVFEAFINGVSVEELIRICRSKPEIAATLGFLDPAELAVHHKDGNHQNNDLSNLEPLTHDDHAAIHDPAQRFNIQPVESRVKRIDRYEIEDTFDISCRDPHHNFIANGIVTHNTGKSLIYTGIANLLDVRTIILTSTKGLQNQLMADFGVIGLTDVRGQNNYKCLGVQAGGPVYGMAPTSVNCDEGPCHDGAECPLKEGGCLYYDQVRRARAARLVVTNYWNWMTINRYSMEGTLGEFDLLVLDEAHSAPEHLAEFCTVDLDRDEVRKLLKDDLPPVNEGMHVWVDWADDALRRCRVKLGEAREETSGIGGRGTKKPIRRLLDLQHKLEELTKAAQWRRSDAARPNIWMPGQMGDWAAEDTEKGARFSPVWAHAYAEDYLFMKIPRIVAVSATI